MKAKLIMAVLLSGLCLGARAAFVTYTPNFDVSSDANTSATTAYAVDGTLLDTGIVDDGVSTVDAETFYFEDSTTGIKFSYTLTITAIDGFLNPQPVAAGFGVGNAGKGETAAVTGWLDTDTSDSEEEYLTFAITGLSVDFSGYIADSIPGVTTPSLNSTAVGISGFGLSSYTVDKTDITLTDGTNPTYVGQPGATFSIDGLGSLSDETGEMTISVGNMGVETGDDRIRLSHVTTRVELDVISSSTAPQIVLSDDSLSLELVAPDTSINGTLAASYIAGSGSSADIEIVSLVASNGFSASVVSSTLGTSNPDEDITVTFDNAVAGLANGETTNSALVVTWTETGSGTTNTSEAALDVTYINEPLELLMPETLSLSVVAPATVKTGSVDVAFSGTAVTSVDVDISVESIYPSAFSVVPPTSFVMTEPSPSNRTVEIVFDNSSAGLVNGESATGLVHMVYNETGSSELATNSVEVTVLYIDDPVAASIFYQKQVIGIGLDWNGAYWTNLAYTVPQMPTAGNTYINAMGGETRANTTTTFLGDSLELRAEGSSLALKLTPVEVNLILNAGTGISNNGGGGDVNGSISSATNNGSGAITFSSGGDGRDINITAPMAIGSNITSMVVDMGNHESDSDENVTINTTSNTFAGVWQVASGHLIGNLEGSLGTASFIVGANGLLNLNYDYDGAGQSLEIAAGGTLLLDQDLTFEQASIGPYPLDAGTYTASELLADPNYSSAIDAASNPGSTLTVLSDPLEYKIAIFNFDATNGVSSDVFAYSDVSDWDLTNAGTGASYTNANAAFNKTANVTANNVANTIDPVSGNYHSFNVAVEGLAAGATLNLNNLGLDYICLSPLGFRLAIYSSVTGQGTNTFMSGDTPLYDSGTINSAGTYDVNVALTNVAFQALENGESIEFRFVIADSSNSGSRIHGIDNINLTGWVDAGLGPHVGEVAFAISGSGAVVGWDTYSGVTYAVQYDDNLTTPPGWTNIDSVVGIDGMMSSTNEMVDPAGFYRVVIP
ncbi:hypothetical protein PDESU_02401 [Pontiella desulfatans]|uniref:Uncharacterized protein n=1 Tax=Pontiella desulfatans TaxID=2750659 RepID=A0A6C2U2G1_PONDE|nr:hypothetical protein [Pontiella desulfatans]VGO13844.1 hypothetical protein PDESU_02401 [Pontiella desulfatans]